MAVDGPVVASSLRPSSQTPQVEFLSQYSWLARDATALGVHYSNTLMTDDRPEGLDLVGV